MFALLMKFSKREYLEEFRQTGLLYMQPLAYFTHLESDGVRSDRFEGSTRIIQPRDLKEFTFTHPLVGTIKGNSEDFAGPVKISLQSTMSCNVYCMFAVSKPVSGEPVDARNLAFGDSFVLVLNTQEFVNRVSLAAQANGLSGSCGFVEYFDGAEHTGDTGPFRKPDIFAYQNEFRFVMKPGSANPIALEIGSLRDITSEVLPIAHANHVMNWSPESLRLAGFPQE
jgi:hypothetical protein